VIDRLVLLGVSHHTAPVAVRERISRLGTDLVGTLSGIKSLPGLAEGMVLSTCNRVELYGAGVAPGQVARSLREFIVERGDIHGNVPELVYERQGSEALRHLFRVASSLDSMVVGEAQILGQLKEAFQAAASAGATGDCLQRAVGRAFAVAKRVRSETEVGRLAVSMSSAAGELARKIFDTLEGRRVMVVGAGEMARLAARHLAGQGVVSIAVANRHLEGAKELAEEVATWGCASSAHRLDELPALLVTVDVILAAAPAPEPVIARAEVARAVRARRFRPLFVVDLSVPRSVDPAIRYLPNVYLKDLDDIAGVVRQNSQSRAGEADRAEAIVDLEVREFTRTLRGRSAAPVLAELRRRADAIARTEAEKTLHQIGEDLDDRRRKSVEAMAQAIVNKLLHGPTARLRRAAELGVEGPLADATAQLFDLGEASDAPAEEVGPPPRPKKPGE
jgi:glutamyl-tRNA reductase